MKKQIDWKKTVFSNIWIYAIIIFLFVNAILYAIHSMELSHNVEWVCFWAFMAIILIREFSWALKVLTFIKYKKENEKKKNN